MRGVADVEADVNDVAILDDVVLALQAQKPLLARQGQTARERFEGLVGDDLGADEAALHVTVYLSRRLARPRTSCDRPGAALVLADREERDDVRAAQRRARDRAPGRLGDAVLGEKGGALVRRNLGHLRLQRGAELEDRRAVLRSPASQLLGRLLARAVLAHVVHRDRGPIGDQAVAAQRRARDGGDLRCRDRSPLVEQIPRELQGA